MGGWLTQLNNIQYCALKSVLVKQVRSYFFVYVNVVKIPKKLASFNLYCIFKKNNFPKIA